MSEAHAVAMPIRLMFCILLVPLQATALAPPSPGDVSRHAFLRRIVTVHAPSAALLLPDPSPARAAPPFAVMEEELGYFPVMNERTGEAMMVPAKIKRPSTSQAVALAKYLRGHGAKMYGAFWCPHCSRQKELFGREAWDYIDYVECAAKGYRTQFAICIEDKVEGYPAWKFGNGKSQGGEMELMAIAEMSGFLDEKGGQAFNPALETGVPPLGGAACK